MKAFPINIILVVCCYLGGSDCFAQQSKKEIKLKPVASRQSIAKDINSLHVLLTADTVQQASEKGIRFFVKIKNDSSASIVINNPIDLLDISLMNTWGKDVHVPTVSRLIINSRGAPHANKTFAFERFAMNGKELKEDIASLKTITLPANGVFEILFNIKHILKPDAVKPYTRDQEIQIQAGDYTLFLTMAIVDATGDKVSSTSPTYASFEMPSQVIHYGNR